MLHASIRTVLITVANVINASVSRKNIYAKLYQQRRMWSVSVMFPVKSCNNEMGTLVIKKVIVEQ